MNSKFVLYLLHFFNNSHLLYLHSVITSLYTVAVSIVVESTISVWDLNCLYTQGQYINAIQHYKSYVNDMFTPHCLLLLS